MTTCNEKRHPNHTHKHGPNCGHTPVRHDGHVDYLHDGHLHHVHGDHVDEHALAMSATNPVHCTPQTRCSHKHGPGCRHETVPHADHVDLSGKRTATPSPWRPLRRPRVGAARLIDTGSIAIRGLLRKSSLHASLQRGITRRRRRQRQSVAIRLTSLWPSHRQDRPIMRNAGPPGRDPFS